MNLGQLIEFAAIASVYSPNLIESSDPVPEAALERYVYWSELRAADWIAALDALPAEIAGAPGPLRPAIWNQAEPTIVDVFAGGLLSRVWGAVLTACDRTRKTFSCERTARRVLERHDQTQQRLLRLLVDGPNLSLERAVSYDRLRRKIERWSDVLVGHVIRRYGLADFAYDAERALEFGEEQLREAAGLRQDQIWDLYFLCLRSSFPEFILPDGAHAERRTEVCRSILGAFPESLFLGDGTMISPGLMRMLAGDSVAEGPPASDGPGAAVIKWPKPVRRIDGMTERRGWN